MANKNYFNHTDSSGKSPFDRMIDVGYHAEHEGENIAAGNSDAQSTYLQWLNSAPHLQNMLNPDFTEIGVGRAVQRGLRRQVVLDDGFRVELTNFKSTGSRQWNLSLTERVSYKASRRSCPCP